MLNCNQQVMNCYFHFYCVSILSLHFRLSFQALLLASVLAFITLDLYTPDLLTAVL